MNTERADRASWGGLTSLLMGGFLLANLLLYRMVGGYFAPAPAVANDLCCGVLMLGFGLAAMKSASAQPNWILTALGSWLVLAPILLAYPDVNPGLVDMFAGVVTATAAIVSGAQKQVVVQQRRRGF